MPKSRNRNKRRPAGRTGNSIDRSLINSFKASAANTSIVSSDLTNRRQNFQIVQRPPKSVGNQIYWAKAITNKTFTTSNTTYVENNYSWTLNDITGFASYTALFDQYCIYSVICSISLSTQDSDASAQLVNLLTAIDYDNTGAIGPGGIGQFSSISKNILTGPTSLVRYVHPCVDVAVYQGGVTTGYGVSRIWLDAASTGVNHYGLRTIALQSYSAFIVDVTFEYVLGFRNTH